MVENVLQNITGILCDNLDDPHNEHMEMNYPSTGAADGISEEVSRPASS